MALTWRVHKQHGVSIKYVGNRRDTYYPDIGVPVLLIPAGDKSPATDGLRSARVHAYHGADHDIHAQHPEAIADDLLGLIA